MDTDPDSILLTSETAGAQFNSSNATELTLRIRNETGDWPRAAFLPGGAALSIAFRALSGDEGGTAGSASLLNATLMFYTEEPSSDSTPPLFQWEDDGGEQLVMMLCGSALGAFFMSTVISCCLLRRTRKWTRETEEAESKGFSRKLAKQRVDWAKDSKEMESKMAADGKGRKEDRTFSILRRQPTVLPSSPLRSGKTSWAKAREMAGGCLPSPSAETSKAPSSWGKARSILLRTAVGTEAGSEAGSEAGPSIEPSQAPGGRRVSLKEALQKAAVTRSPPSEPGVRMRTTVQRATQLRRQQTMGTLRRMLSRPPREMAAVLTPTSEGG